MASGPTARIGDMVFFPSYGLYPIVTGNFSCLNSGRPTACLGDMVACPGGGVMITGNSKVLNSGRPTCTTGDLAYSPVCGMGTCVSGDYSCIKGP